MAAGNAAWSTKVPGPNTQPSTVSHVVREAATVTGLSVILFAVVVREAATHTAAVVVSLLDSCKRAIVT